MAHKDHCAKNSNGCCYPLGRPNQKSPIISGDLLKAADVQRLPDLCKPSAEALSTPLHVGKQAGHWFEYLLMFQRSLLKTAPKAPNSPLIAA